MKYFGIDLAGMADFEYRGGSLLLGSAEDDDFRFFADPAQAFAEAPDHDLVTHVLEWVAVRPRDPRIDEILRLWCHYLKPVPPLEDERVLHGRQLKIVFFDQIAEFHIIPKSMGMPNLEDPDSDEVKYPVFDPQIYHTPRAIVFPWLGSEQPFLMALRLGTGKALYYETSEHYLAFRMSVSIDRPPVGQSTLHEVMM